MRYVETVDRIGRRMIPVVEEKIEEKPVETIVEEKPVEQKPVEEQPVEEQPVEAYIIKKNKAKLRSMFLALETASPMLWNA